MATSASIIQDYFFVHTRVNSAVENLLTLWYTKIVVYNPLLWYLNMIKMKKIGWISWAFALGFFILDLICGSVIIGSQTGHLLNFSLRHAITPLLGIWGGACSVCILFLGKGLIHACAALGSRLLLTWHLPTLTGALYFSLLKKDTFYTRLIAALPALICMILFWLHPVGQLAALYPLYWIIPALVALTGQKNFFLQALGSTFTAHAVGSVLWLYGGLLTAPAAWTALIPIIAFERFGFACLMAAIFYAVQGTTSGIRSWYGRTDKSSLKSYVPLFCKRRNP